MDIRNYGITQSIKPVLYKQKNNIKAQVGYTDSKSIINSLNFLGNYNTPIVNKSIDNPIQNDEEFNEVMKKVYSAKTRNGIDLWIVENYRDVFPDYKNATDIEMGLIPYCGESDNSKFINMYLSGRLNDDNVEEKLRGFMPEDMNSCVDVVRALDYSLKNLDKEFGNYKGIVFREGFMSENGNQYFSTSKAPLDIGLAYSSWYDFDPRVGYSVIRLKNGHKIYEFQEKMGSEFAEREIEVLTPRNSKFHKVAPEEMDDELTEARDLYINHLLPDISDILLGKKENQQGLNKEAFLNYINIYDQI